MTGVMLQSSSSSRIGIYFQGTVWVLPRTGLATILAVPYQQSGRSAMSDSSRYLVGVMPDDPKMGPSSRGRGRSSSPHALYRVLRPGRSSSAWEERVQLEVSHSRLFCIAEIFEGRSETFFAYSYQLVVPSTSQLNLLVYSLTAKDFPPRQGERRTNGGKAVTSRTRFAGFGYETSMGKKGHVHCGITFHSVL